MTKIKEDVLRQSVADMEVEINRRFADLQRTVSGLALAASVQTIPVFGAIPDPPDDGGGEPRVTHPKVQTPRPISAPTAYDKWWKDDLIEKFSKEASWMMVWSRLMISDAFTPEDRDRLRRNVGEGHGIFQLAALLGKLCSETARNQNDGG